MELLDEKNRMVLYSILQNLTHYSCRTSVDVADVHCKNFPCKRSGPRRTAASRIVLRRLLDPADLRLRRKLLHVSPSFSSLKNASICAPSSPRGRAAAAAEIGLRPG